MYVRIFTCAFTHTRTHARTQTHAHKHTHTHTHTHAHTHTHTHTRTHTVSSSPQFHYSDVIAPSDPEQSSQLFQHVLTHPTTFGMQTLDLFDGTGESLQLCLHWKVTPDILEGELGAEMLEEYSVDSVLVRYEDLTHHFIFVVHKTQSFPSDTVSDIVKDCYVPVSPKQPVLHIIPIHCLSYAYVHSETALSPRGQLPIFRGCLWQPLYCFHFNFRYVTLVRYIYIY